MDPKTPPPPPASQAQLPVELIYYGILPRLPARPLVRFAAVCKAWRDLILRDAAFAAMQAQSPSPASTALARFNNGRIEVLTPGGVAASVAPPDPGLSFLTAGGRYTQLKLCACTAGLLCFTAVHSETQRSVVCVVNPETSRYNVVRHWYPRGVVGLAYDPAARRGYHVIVAVMSEGTCKFLRLSPEQAAGAGAWYEWRAPRDEVRLAPSEGVMPMAEYAGGRVHWLTCRGNIVWHDVASELSGTLRAPSSPSGRRRIVDGNLSIAAWRGRLRLVRAGLAGLGVWELASYGGGGAGAPAAQWDIVHWRSWSAIPGVVEPDRCFLWSVVPAGMEAGGEEAIGLALRCAHTRVVGWAAKRKRSPRKRPLSSLCDQQEADRAEATSSKSKKLSTPSMRSHVESRGEPEPEPPVHHETETRAGATPDVEDGDVWRRALVRYETRTGATAEAVVLTGAQVHDYFGTVFCYHSSLAALPLPDLNMDA